MSESNDQIATPQAHASGCLTRLTWMLFGNLVLFFSALALTNNYGFYLSWADLALWAAVVVMIGARYLDIKRLGGLTAGGEPANMGHWRRYALIMVAVGAVLWIGGHLLAWRGA